MIKHKLTASVNQFASGKSFISKQSFLSTSSKGNTSPNICFGYRIKMIRACSPNTEIIRIKGSVYKQFLASAVNFKWSEKEVREAMDTEL